MNTRATHHCLPMTLPQAVLACGLALAGPASAIAIGGPAGTADQGRNTIADVATPATAAAPAPANELSSGRIDDLSPGQVTIRGKAIGLHPTRLRVVAPGGHSQSGAGSLRKGQQVRYALDAGSGEAARRIVLIYIDR
ncbi:hypothetical protein [Ideonella sp. A 288]|uniref:hypothetical protein n=1 Tax=Ideonella sp. A 288 TaxID=1962181 RepID=UPI00118497E5|nr:hypothetical protein [Ideonella sp. A 288]